LAFFGPLWFQWKNPFTAHHMEKRFHTFFDNGWKYHKMGEGKRLTQFLGGSFIPSIPDRKEIVF